MKSWGRHGAEPMQKAAFGNHHRDLHCKQGWLSVHTNPLENGLNAVRLKVSAGWRRLTDWGSTICVLCRLGSDDGAVCRVCRQAMWNDWQDRKSTRLNSSHVAFSYAVFCLKKKST